MTYKMNEFTGIDHSDVAKLQEANIETSDDVMRVWADKTTRDSMVEKTGIGMERFGQIASMARLARVKNVGPKYVEVLLAAGIDGPNSLFELTPEALVKRLQEVKIEKGLTSPVPAMAEIETWFAEKRPVGAF